MERPTKRQRLACVDRLPSTTLGGLDEALWLHIIHAHLRLALAPLALLNHAFAHLVGEYVRLRTNNLAYDTSECISIVCLNYIDSELYPRHFEYSLDEESCEEGANYACECGEGPCVEKSSCACWSLSQGFVYGKDGNLKSYEGREDVGCFLFECHSYCRCSDQCALKATKISSKNLKLSLQKFPRKGWGVVIEGRIEAGHLVGVYVGEYLSDAEADLRLRQYLKSDQNYLLILKQHVYDPHARAAHGSDCIRGNEQAIRTNVDATLCGNFTRFINHSCSPNLVLLPIYRGNEEPLLAFQTVRAIDTGEELTFSYGSAEDAQSGTIPCSCGSMDCLGFLPFTRHV